MSATIPLTINQEAADFIADKALQKPFHHILDNIPKRIPGVQAIAVSLQEPYDLGGEARVILDVTRDHPGLTDDPTERQWERWVVENFPPEEFEHFVLLTIYKTFHAG